MAKRKKHKKKQKKQQKKQQVHKEVKKEKKPTTFLEKVKHYYITEYRKLFFIPITLFVLAFIVLAITYAQTGDFLKRDVTLKGGISLILNTDYSDIPSLELYLSEELPEASINIRTIESRGSVIGIIIEASDTTDDLLLNAVKEKVEFEDYSIETMGSALGNSFFKQMFVAVLVAFLFMGLVFQLYFRNYYATFAALFSAFLDIFITMAIIDLIGVRLTAGGIAAYLMLIGYSIDTSILLSTKLLKERSSDKNKALFDAMKTGLTMSAAGLAATGISFLLTNNSTLKQIMLILIVGLVIDLITTWISNVSFLRFYMERQNVKN
jgi:preprotein translocase subunit SecF